MFEPIAVETLGVFNASAIRLLNDLGRRISSISGDTRDTSHFISANFGAGAAFQCCSATRQPAGPGLTARTEHHTLSVIFINNLKPPSGIDTEG